MLDESGDVLALVEVPITTLATPDGGVELDPADVWSSIVTAGQRALAESGVIVGAVGIANQGEAVVAWDRHTGEATSRIISWQDRRSIGVVERLRDFQVELQQRTGLALDPYFTAPKLRWLRDRTPASSVVTGIDAWINRQLLGESVTDVATASRSLLLDLDTRVWSEQNAALFGLDVDDLPRLVSSAEHVGTTSAFGPTLPVTALVVDQQAALIGEGCLTAGDAKCTYGTGAFFLVGTGGRAVRSAAGLSSSVAWTTPSDAAYCLDGQVYTAGSAIRWLEEVGLLDSASALDHQLAEANPRSPTLCVPAFAGLGAPHWSPESLARFEGISLATSRADITRAVVEAIAAQVAVIARSASRDMAQPLTRLKVDGGLTQSTALLQMQADFLQLPLDVFGSPHATAFGVHALARLGAGEDQALRAPAIAPSAHVEPRLSADEAADRIATWEAAVARTVEEAGQ